MLLRAAWLAAQAAVAGWYLASGASDRHALLLFAAALSLPAGLLVPWIVAPLARPLDTSGSGDIGSAANLVIWLGTVGAGYWQWFVLLPNLRRAAAGRRWKRDAGRFGGPGNPWPRE